MVAWHPYTCIRQKINISLVTKHLWGYFCIKDLWKAFLTGIWWKLYPVHHPSILYHVFDSCTRQTFNMSSISMTDTTLSPLMAFGILISYNWPDSGISYILPPRCHFLHIESIKKQVRSVITLLCLVHYGQWDRVINRFSLGLLIRSADLNEISDKKSVEWCLITSRSFAELINLRDARDRWAQCTYCLFSP